MLSCFHRKIKFTFLNLFEIGRTHDTIVMQMVHVVEAQFHKLDLGKAVCALLHNITCIPKKGEGQPLTMCVNSIDQSTIHQIEFPIRGAVMELR